jgi:hypothetical protein
MSFDILDSVEKGLSPKKNIGVQEFAESSDYCDKYLYLGQTVLLKLIFLEEMTGAEEDVLDYWIGGGRNGSEITISPSIRERRDYLRGAGYNHFREVNLVGGRRSSKGFVTGMAVAKVMYETLQLQDPGTHYGIDTEKDIYFACVAGSESQAKEYQYADLVSTVENCKAFEPYLVKSLETEFRVATPTDLRKTSAAKSRGSKIQRDIAKLRGKALAANAGTLRGLAAMAIVMDEMAHMLPGESKSSADQVYNAADPSLDQFDLDGIMFLNSSPYTKVGKFYECYEGNLKPFDPTQPVSFVSAFDDDSDEVGGQGNGNPRNMTLQYPSWALFEGYRHYKSKWKPKERGRQFGSMVTVSPDWDPEEVDDQGREKYTDRDKANILQARAKEAANPETYKVERRGKFAEVTDAYLNASMVDQMYKGIPEGFDHMPNGDVIRHYRPLLINEGVGASNLHKYKFHVDPSSTTAGFGFAIGHIEYIVDSYSGEETEHVIFDLIKRWDPKDFQGKVIRWDPILEEIFRLAMIFRPFEITMDQHQSAEPMQRLQQMLNERNVQCRVYEVPTTNELNWKRWEVFKTALYQGLIHAPWNEAPNTSPTGTGSFTSKDELKFLQRIPTGGKFDRVEKQDIGPVRTKDMADAICVVVHALIGNMFVTQMRDRLAQGSVAVGSQGGYGLGLNRSALQTSDPNSGGYYSGREMEKRSQMSRSSLTRGALGANRGSRTARRGR